MEFIKPKFKNRNEFPSGVYKITFNDKWFYIGSSYNLKKRFVRWKTSVHKPYFFNSKKIKEILPQVVLVNIEILKICNNYKEEESNIITSEFGNPNLLNERIPPEFKIGRVGRFDIKNNLIEIHNDIYDAARSINCRIADIQNDLKGKRCNVKGFRFKALDSNDNFIEHEVKGRHPSASKLSVSQIKEIRILRKKGIALKELAIKYNVKYGVIYRVAQNLEKNVPVELRY